MTNIADLQRLGFLPVQHLDYDAPPLGGTPWELDLRAALWACRVRDRDSARADNPNAVGHYWVGDTDYGDVTGFMFWPELDGKRPVPTVRDVFPTLASAALVEGSAPTFGRGGPFGVVVVRKPWETDDRLQQLRTDQPEYLPEPVGGLLGLAVQAQEEREQLELWYSTDPRMIAPDRGGKAENGSIVCDVSSTGDADVVKRGRLQSHMRVVHADGEYRIGIQATLARRGGSGFGLSYGRGDGGQFVVNYDSHERGGPLHPGHGSRDKHVEYVNAEGERVQPRHIRIGAFFYEDRERDGPKEHGPDYPERVIDRQIKTKVYEGWDRKTQQWRRWTTTPIIPPPWVPLEPPTDKVPPTTVPIPREGVPSGAPTGGGTGGPGVLVPVRVPTDVAVLGDVPLRVDFLPVEPPDGSARRPYPLTGEPLTGTTESPLNPALHEQELAPASVVFPSVRDRDSQPYDGRYGGAGVDTETDDDETLAGPQGEFQRLVGRRRIGGRGGTLSQSAEDRGGPAPFVGHMWAEGQVLAGAHQYKSEPGAAYGNGNALAGALYVGPHVLADGDDDQDDLLGQLDVLLYAAHRGGSAVRRFGWGTYDRNDDLATGFAGLQSSGTSSARNLEARYTDANGAARAGVLTSYGSIVGGPGGNIGFGQHADLAITDTSTTLLTIGTDEQLQFATFAAKAGGYTANLDLDTTGAVHGNWFNVNIEIAAEVTPGDTVSVVVRNGSGGSTLRTIVSAASGIIRRDLLGYFDGTNWRVKWLVTNLP